MNRTGSPPPLWGAAGKAGYVLSCIAASLVLAISGFSYFVVKDVSAIGGSHAIVSGPSIGAQNILLMGLESRTDWNGNILPDDVLKALHAGSRAGGKKAVGFSIPRDDWVTFPTAYDGQTQGKIDQAYGLALAAEENQLRAQNPNMSQDQIAFQGNEAGRAAAVATVEQVTGVHIDHFAEVNLDGFYELAKVLNGVEVCLLHPVAYDANSGFYARKAGLQHLNAQMTLAFVDSVIHQLRDEGVLDDLTTIQSLLSVAKQYVITDSGWDLLDFITQMRSLTSGDLTFRTLPIVGYQTIDGQDANVINTAYIQQIVHETFYPSPATASPSASPRPTVTVAAGASKVTVDVYNGGSTQGLAGEVSAALVKEGYLAGTVTNTSPLTTTEVLYGTGTSANANSIAAMFGVTATPATSIAAGHVEILLGADAALPGASATPTPTTSVVPIPTTGPQGGAVNAKDGIPCVN